MKKIIAFSGLFLLCFHFLFAQLQQEITSAKAPLGGTVFFQNNKRLSMRQLYDITSNNPLALEEIKTARANNTLGTVFGYIGGALIGWPLGTALGGGKPNWTLAAVGAGFISAGIPISISSMKHARKGVAIYNQGLNNKTGRLRPEYRLGITANSIGLKINL